MLRCKNCNKILNGKDQKKFCSRSCSASYNNRKSPKRTAIKVFCLNCGADLTDKKNWRRRKFCNNKCQADYRWKEIVIKIELGEVVYSRHYKKYLTETRGHRCEICGLETWQGQKAPLVMDHIDGNSDNWSLSNLRLVCGNCDMQLPTYKAKNTGNGRHYRRVRYKEGKSY